MFALVDLRDNSIVKTYADTSERLDLPSGVSVFAAMAGWVSDDGNFKVVAVTPFVVPDGQQLTGGAASYSFDGTNVIETLPTQAISVPPPPSPASLAQAALDASDVTALRCFKAGVPFPAEWLAYTNTLRAIVRNNAGDLPTRPAYPAGT